MFLSQSRNNLITGKGRTGKPRPGLASALSVFLLILALTATGWAQTGPTSPEDFFGFRLGSDRQIARWDKIIEYFNLLAEQTETMKVIDMGPSTMGNPFLLVIISSEENLAKLNRLQEINARLNDPMGIPEDEIRNLVKEGKAVICQSMSLHATEIGGTQMAPELAYDLVSRTDEETRRILENVVFFMIPCFNPDGQIMVTDWYRKTLGTQYEGSGLPWLYHKYAGHDNNRDGDFINLKESEYAAKILYRDWIPQAYIDHHQMGSNGARLYIPPYCEPIRPYADPLVWREMSWYGAHMAYKLEENGKSGIINAAQFPGWGHFGWHWITPFHNIAGMLTESASCSVATPLFIHPDQLRGGSLQFPEYEAQTNFPHPWPGGWWKLRDIVEQKKISAWALLDLAARNKETVLWNAYLKAKRQTERGANGKPAAYIIPASQHDPLTAVKMINTLLLSGIKIERAGEAFAANGVIYPEGSFLVRLAQPKMGLIRHLLDRTPYPDNYWTRDKDGSPIRPYDLATHTMSEFMGVRVDPTDDDIQGKFQKLAEPVHKAGQIEKAGWGHVLDGRLNDSFKAVNLLLEKGAQIGRSVTAEPGIRQGDFIVTGASEAAMGEVAEKTGVDFRPLEAKPKEELRTVRRARIGMYQRYAGGNMDEGWTRLVLDNFAFPYTSVFDAEIKKGNLNAKYRTIVLPHDSPGMMTGERTERYGGRRPVSPPEYLSGFGQDGVEALVSFVDKGGTLVAIGEACMLAIDKFGLSIRNPLAGLPGKDFFCPGSTLRTSVENGHPLGYGMPPESLVVFYGNPVFEVTPGSRSEGYEVIARYAENNVLGSGWLIGEKHIAGKAAMVVAKYGKGQIVLIGFRAQHRSQTHGTFKLFFNALID